MKLSLHNINFEITKDCNHDCLFCYNYVEKTNQNKSTTPIRTLSSILNKVNVKQITFTGGEPLLRKDLLECVIHAKVSNCKVVIITNGNAGSDKQFEDLITAGVDHFQVSFHSVNPEIHNSLTRQDNSWQKTTERIKFILSNGCRVIPSIVLTKININSLPETLNYLYNMGLSTIMINRYNITHSAIGKIDTLLPTKKELNLAFEKANLFASKNKVKITSNVCTPHCIVNPKYFSEIGFGECSNDLLLKPLTIDQLGNFRICNHSPHVIGNIHHQNFTDLIYSDYSCDWLFSTPEYCEDCDLEENCNAGCRAASEQLGLTKEHVDPIVNYCHD